MFDIKLPEGLIDMDGKVSTLKLSAILGLNVSCVYAEAQKGRLPTDINNATYRECIQRYINHFKKNQDLKIEQELTKRQLAEVKLKEEARLKLERQETRRQISGRTSKIDSEDMNPLVAAKMKQDIRLGVAKEAEIWQRAMITRGDYLSTASLLEVVEPLIHTLRNVFISLASISPEAEEQVDLAMETLYSLGTTLLENAEAEKKGFIEDILAKEVDFDELDSSEGTKNIL